MSSLEGASFIVRASFSTTGRKTTTTGVLLMNAETGEVLCAHPFSARSSERLPSVKRPSKYDLPTLETPTIERVETDLQRNFRAELHKVMAEMSGYRLTPVPE